MLHAAALAFNLSVSSVLSEDSLEVYDAAVVVCRHRVPLLAHCALRWSLRHLSPGIAAALLLTSLKARPNAFNLGGDALEDGVFLPVVFGASYESSRRLTLYDLRGIDVHRLAAGDS